MRQVVIRREANSNALLMVVSRHPGSARGSVEPKATTLSEVYSFIL